MNDNEKQSEKSQSTAFGALGFLANNPLLANPNEEEPIPNETSASNEKNDNFDDENTQRQMNEFISELQSESITPDDQNLRSRKSVTSGHFIDNGETNSTPAIMDSSSNNPPQSPLRSMSESALIDTTEHPPTLPIQKDESSTEEEEEEEESDDNEEPANPTRENNVGETTRSANSSRVPSASHKRSPSVLSNGKQAQLSNDVDREVANISRRSARSKSPLNRPQSPALESPRQTPTNVKPTRVQSSSSSSSSDDQREERKQPFEPPIAIISSASLPPAAKKSLHDDTSSESSIDQSEDQRSKLTKPGEQLQIPTNDINNQRLNSPPPSTSQTPTTKKSLHDDTSSESSTDQPEYQQSKLTKPGEQLQIPTNDIDNQRLNNPPSSTSRPPTAKKSQHDDTSSESSIDQSKNQQSKLVKPGEQLQIPTNDIDNQQLNSRPPTAKKSQHDDTSSESSIDQSENQQSKLVKPGEQLQIPTNDINNQQLPSPPSSASRPPTAKKSLHNDTSSESSRDQSKDQQSKLTKPGEQLQIPTNDIDNQRLPSPSSSASRPPTAKKSLHDDASSESSRNQSKDQQSKLVKPGEQLQIPTNDIDNQRLPSPSSSASRPPTAKKSLHDDASSESSRNQSKDQQSKLVKPGEQLQIPTNNIDNQRLPSPPSSTSRPPTAKKSLHNDTSSESPKDQSEDQQSKLIKPGEQLQIPTNDINNQRLNSRPPSASRPPTAKKSLHGDTSSESPKDQSEDQQSKLSQPGEQLQIPTNDIDNQRLNSPPPSPSITKQMMLSNSPSENNFPKVNQESSRPPSQTNRKSPTGSSVSNGKLIGGDVVSGKSRPSSNISHQHKGTADQKLPSASSRKGTNASENDPKNPEDSRQSSTDVDVPTRTSAKQKSPLHKRSAQQSRKNSSNTTDRTVTNPIKISSSKSREQNEKPLSTTDTENERSNLSKLPPVRSSSPSTTATNDNQTNAWTKQAPIPPLETTEDEVRQSRPQSPNVEQIAERNQHSSSNKTQNEGKKKDQTRRSNSTESFNRIPLVDDSSLDSASGNNTELEDSKHRRVKSKKKDVETNTDSLNGNQQQREITSQKSSKTTKPMSDHSPSIRRRVAKQPNTTTPDTEPESNTQPVRRSLKKSKSPHGDKDPDNIPPKNQENEDANEKLPKINDKKQIVKLSPDHERHTQSDTEQIINEKQKKRRRPKRISRTTQTYECVFRRMEHEQHDELRPTNDTDKNIQTRKSRLRPVVKSPKRHYPIYLSTDEFKIEEILPKQFPSAQRNNLSKSSVIARNNSPQGGKLLILRPTLPFHHTDAVNIQRISLQYAIDLIPNENKRNETPPGQRNKGNALKQLEETNTLPMIRSSSSTAILPAHKANTKDKSATSKIEDRTYQRKTGGAV